METSEIIQLLRDHISIRIEQSNEYECDNLFTTTTVSLIYIDDNGDEHTISEDYDSVCVSG